MAVSNLQKVATLNDLPEPARIKLSHLLNTILADTIDLELQTKQAHWNVKGPQFYSLHLLFDNLADTIHEFVDLIGERCAALGGYPTGTVRSDAGRSSLPDYPEDILDGRAHVEALITRYARYGSTVRQAIATSEEWGDRATADLFTEVTRAVDKGLWMLESHVQV
jgi:starvation-inducible DNA-binding protein